MPGAGKGPEALWHIDYTPAVETTADKAAFAVRVVKKFGPATKIFDAQEDYWADQVYDSALAFSQANTPVLRLTTYSAELVLENPGILRHLESVCNSCRTTAQPQL